MTYKSAFELFKTSKELVLKNPLPFFVIVFLPAFLPRIGDVINGGSTSPFGNFLNTSSGQGNPNILHFLGWLLSVVLIPAGFYLEIQAVKGKKPDTTQTINDSTGYFWRLLGLFLVMSVIIVAGLIALIVPGIIFIQRYFLAPYFLVDKNMGIKAALSASAAASKGNAGAIWGVIGVMILLSMFAIIPLVGGVVALGLTTLYACASALRYQELVLHNTDKSVKIKNPVS